MKKSLALLLVLLPLQGHAMSIEHYREQVQKAGRTKGEVHVLALAAYHAGIADSVTALLQYNGGVIMNQGDPFICPSKSAQIDAKLIEAVMRQQLNDPEPLAKLLGPNWEKASAFQLAFAGLWRTFPCK